MRQGTLHLLHPSLQLQNPPGSAPQEGVAKPAGKGRAGAAPAGVVQDKVSQGKAQHPTNLLRSKPHQAGGVLPARIPPNPRRGQGLQSRFSKSPRVKLSPVTHTNHDPQRPRFPQTVDLNKAGTSAARTPARRPYLPCGISSSRSALPLRGETGCCAFWARLINAPG